MKQEHVRNDELNYLKRLKRFTFPHCKNQIPQTKAHATKLNMNHHRLEISVIRTKSNYHPNRLVWKCELRWMEHPLQMGIIRKLVKSSRILIIVSCLLEAKLICFVWCLIGLWVTRTELVIPKPLSQFNLTNLTFWPLQIRIPTKTVSALHKYLYLFCAQPKFTHLFFNQIGTPDCHIQQFQTENSWSIQTCQRLCWTIWLALSLKVLKR